MPPKLETRNLRRAVDGEAVVDGVSLAVAPGEVLAILGPSGAGKSSFLRLLNRLDEPTDGEVFLDGSDYRETPPRDLRRRVGFVPQRPALRGGTVFENVAIGPRLRGEPVAEDRVADLLAAVGLDSYGPRDVGDLSGGEAQRVALARTLLTDPEVLLLDEPTSSLDPESERQIERALESLVDESGATVVLVTHDERQAGRLADRIARFADGRLVGVEPASAVVP
jgi:putative ABC transport system ATP-binding protein